MWAGGSGKSLFSSCESDKMPYVHAVLAHTYRLYHITCPETWCWGTDLWPMLAHFDCHLNHTHA
jgi:hypothetical protein